MRKLYTIGYESTDLARFLRTLKAAGVEAIADVRAVTVSRKKGFSKNKLREALEDWGIGYEHFAALGDPKPGRTAAREGRYRDFVSIYSTHLDQDEAQENLDELIEFASKQATCLLCFERDPAICHRTIVAQQLSVQGFTIVNLYGDVPEQYERNNRDISRGHSRQGVTSA